MSESSLPVTGANPAHGETLWDNGVIVAMDFENESVTVGFEGARFAPGLLGSRAAIVRSSDAEASTEAPPSPQPRMCALCSTNEATGTLTFSGRIVGVEHADVVAACDACTEGLLGPPVSGADQ